MVRGRVPAANDQNDNPNLTELREQTCRNRDQLRNKNEVVPQPNLQEVVTILQRQLIEQQQIINALMAHQQANHTASVAPLIDPPVPPVALVVVVRQEPYLIQW